MSWPSSFQHMDIVIVHGHSVSMNISAWWLFGTGNFQHEEFSAHENVGTGRLPYWDMLDERPCIRYLRYNNTDHCIQKSIKRIFNSELFWSVRPQRKKIKLPYKYSTFNVSFLCFMGKKYQKHIAVSAPKVTKQKCKGQLISKTNCQNEDSPKKRTN